MRNTACITIILLISSLFMPFAAAQTASEVPLENPEVLKPDSRPKGNLELPDSIVKQGMTLERLTEIVRTLDPEAEIRDRAMQLSIADTRVTIITDPKNNRMRAYVPIQSLDGVNQQLLYRLLQANFDSALDARYAIAREHILSVFIHPLSELDKDQLIEGLGQVVNLVKTYGTAFTSGAMTFGGGDSRNLHRKLIDELLKKGEEI